MSAVINEKKIEEAASRLCKYYCRFPIIWSEAILGKLEDSEMCFNCPLSDIKKEMMKGKL